MMPYERYLAWEVADELAVEVYRVTRTWPKAELFGLTAQIRRAAVSAPTNLADGAAKLGRREFARHANIALGLLSEVSYLLRFARKVEYLSTEDHDRLQSLRNRAGQLTWRLLRALRSSG